MQTKQLLSLEIENYRSFYKRQILSFGIGKARRVTAIFGANSGGKSNTARALALIQHIIFNSASANWNLPYEPFLLKQDSDKKPTYFKLSFATAGRFFTYEFGFEADRVVFEELKEKSDNTQKMKTIFTRNNEGNLNSSAGKFGFGASITRKTRRDTLLLTKAREDNNEYANIVFDLMNSIQIIQGDSTEISNYSIELFKQNANLQKMTLDLMKKCDFHIRGFIVDEIVVNTSHAVRDDERTVIGERQFDFMSQESMGTKKFFELAVPITDALERGNTVYIDEFGAFLNPLLSNAIVELFKSKNNESGATLVLNTHNTSIMSEAELSRDDIVFVEKTLGEESRINTLSSKSVRENEAFEKRYRSGFYGATPIIKDRA